MTEPSSRDPAEVTGVSLGTLINHTWEIQGLLSSGGMGEVYHGRNIHDDTRVAIKIVLPSLAHDPKIVALFREEARNLGRIHHEAVVRYLAFTKDPVIGRSCLVMEFVDGQPLSDRIKAGPLPEDEVLRLLRRVASGLDKAHEQVAAHRDLSPDNVMLQDGLVDRARIIDFGIAKSLDLGGGTLLGGQFAGKFKYVAPEQLGAFGAKVDRRSDIYSLALVIAAALRGRELDMGGSIVDAVQKRAGVPDLSEVPERFRPLLARMLTPDPAQRPATMAEVLHLLDHPEDLAAASPPAEAGDGDRTVFGGQITPFDGPGAMAETQPEGAVPESPVAAGGPGWGRAPQGEASQPRPYPVADTEPNPPIRDYSGGPPPVTGHAADPRPQTPPPGPLQGRIDEEAPVAPPPQEEASPFGAPDPPAPRAAPAGEGARGPEIRPAQVAPKGRGGLWGIVALLVLAGAGTGIWMLGRPAEAPGTAPDPVALAPTLEPQAVAPPPVPASASVPPAGLPLDPSKPEAGGAEGAAAPMPPPQPQTGEGAAVTASAISAAPPSASTAASIAAERQTWLVAHLPECARFFGPPDRQVLLYGQPEGAADALAGLEAAYQAAFGAPAALRRAPLHPAQCPALGLLADQPTAGVLGFTPEKALSEEASKGLVLRSGGVLRGQITGLGGRALALLVVDDSGGVTGMNSFLTDVQADHATLALPLNLNGAAGRPLLLLGLASPDEIGGLGTLSGRPAVGPLLERLTAVLAASQTPPALLLQQVWLDP